MMRAATTSGWGSGGVRRVSAWAGSDHDGFEILGGAETSQLSRGSESVQAAARLGD